ncbi:MAG TPA: hypothetical protein VK358_16900 [Longimicrobium sp.]|nr:hypothetical protein [Longimicrobium sp.]
MQVTDFVAVDHVLSVIQETACFETYTLSMVFANAAARAGVAGKAGEPGTAKAYYTAWISGLGQLGWAVREGGSTRMANRGGQATTTLASEISARVQAEAPDIPIAAMLAALQPASGTAPPAALSFWWGHATSIPGTIHLTFANVSAPSGTVKLSAAALMLDTGTLQAPKARLLGKPQPVDCSSFTCLSSDVLASSVNLASHYIVATVDLQAFAPQRSDLQARMGDKAQDHIVPFPPNVLKS